MVNGSKKWDEWVGANDDVHCPWPRLGNPWCILAANQREAKVTEPHQGNFKYATIVMMVSPADRDD